MPVKRSVKKVEIVDESVVNLKNRNIEKADSVFRVNPIESDEKYDSIDIAKRVEAFMEKPEVSALPSAVSDVGLPPNVAVEPKDLIRVKFEKFVQLVASKDFLSILEKNRNEDIILSSNLLTELAGAVEEKSEKKSPVVFLIGLAIGVIITYLLIK